MGCFLLLFSFVFRFGPVFVCEQAVVRGQRGSGSPGQGVWAWPPVPPSLQLCLHRACLENPLTKGALKGLLSSFTSGRNGSTATPPTAGASLGWGPSQFSPLPPRRPGRDALGKKDTCDSTHPGGIRRPEGGGGWGLVSHGDREGAVGAGEGMRAGVSGGQRVAVGTGARGGMGAGVSGDSGTFWTCMVGTTAQQFEHT